MLLNVDYQSLYKIKNPISILNELTMIIKLSTPDYSFELAEQNPNVYLTKCTIKDTQFKGCGKDNNKHDSKCNKTLKSNSRTLLS